MTGGSIPRILLASSHWSPFVSHVYFNELRVHQMGLRGDIPCYLLSDKDQVMSRDQGAPFPV